MTNKQINIAIAEACGWRCCKRDMRIAELVHTHPYHGLVGIEPKAKEYDGSKDYQYWVVPNYASDLNAMHEAEMSLPVEGFNGQEWDQSRSEFRWRLRLICIQPCHATARQRAEAFLRTIGKWEESES